MPGQLKQHKDLDNATWPVPGHQELFFSFLVFMIWPKADKVSHETLLCALQVFTMADTVLC